MQTKEIKEEIKKSYGNIAKGNSSENCCNGQVCCTTSEFDVSMTEDYTKISGYQKQADLALGCGIPTEIANIKPGDTVVDLGSGAGNDVFIARKIVGENGSVIGVDMTPEMVIKALQNNQKLGFKNVEFQVDEIENMKSVLDNIADVVISNCVMNLVPNKAKAFAEVFRILKMGGHFSISDIVYTGSFPDKILEAAEMHTACIAGASEKAEYLGIIKSAGFKNIQIKKERLLELPDELLLKYLTEKEHADYKKSKAGIYSITVYADKLEEGKCCETTEQNCCGSEAKNEVQGNCCI